MEMEIMLNNTPVIEKTSIGFSLVFPEVSSSLVLLKANLSDGTTDSVWVECNGESDIYSFDFPTRLWKSATLVSSTFPLFKAERQAGKLRTGEHHTPPKGYPTKRSDYAVPAKYVMPIDKPHIRPALSYFSRHRFASPAEKQVAARRILNRAKRYGIKVDPDSIVAQAAKGKKTKTTKVTWIKKEK